jgi:hypothetical protein
VQVRVVGRVEDLSRDGRAFSVQAGEVGFRVEPAFATRFPTLREGDRVLVLGTLRSQTRLAAREIRVLGQREPRALTGVIQEIDRRRSRIGVRGDQGDLVVVEYTEDTLFARLGRRVDVNQLRVGDEVWVDGRWLGPRQLRAARVEVTASRDRWQAGQSGEVVSIDRRDRILRVEFGEDTRLVRVLPEANISRGTRDMPFNDLVPGDQIRVSGELRGEVVEARSIEVLERAGSARTVEGRVRGIDLEERVLRVTVNSLIPITVRVYVPPDAQISRGTSRLSLSQIREGDRIRARGPSRDSRVIAETVEILP